MVDKMVRTSKPLRMWIDGKCFNIKQFKKHKSIANIINEEKTENHAVNAQNFNITAVDDGKMATSFRLPAIYYIRLNSHPNFDITKFQTETNTDVTFPKNGNEGSLCISGNHESDVITARNIIQSVLCEIREKTPAAQFISIPVNTEGIQKKVQQFKKEVLSEESVQGMDESLFMPSPKLHLTVVVFALMDDSEKAEAIAALNDCKTEVIEPFIASNGPLKIKVAGIDTMNENLKKTRILYANAKIEHSTEQDVLQKFVNSISDYFYERGLVRQYQDNVKLHVTLINTKYRKSSANSSPSKSKRSKWHYKNETFDATTIMEKYKDFDFGECILQSVHLSQMSAVGDDGFYKPLAVINV